MRAEYSNVIDQLLQIVANKNDTLPIVRQSNAIHKCKKRDGQIGLMFLPSRYRKKSAPKTIQWQNSTVFGLKI